MSQHDFDLANAPGASFRSDLNNALDAFATNNSGAAEPAAMFANMWWFDTSTNILKQRNNANDAWINVALKDGNGWTPYRQGTQIGTAALLTTDTDGALAANSDSKAATQKAVKTYADGKISKTTAAEISAMTEKTTLHNDDLFLIEDSEASNAKKKVKKSNLGSISGFQIFTSDGNFTAPQGVTKVYLTMVGGGGGGGAGSGNPACGGGGGGGGYIINYPYTVIPGNSYAVDVGAGGAASSDGADTTFDSAVTAGKGTKGGDAASPTGGAGGGGLDGSGTTPGGYVMKGGNGADGTGSIGGGGGGSPFGAGGAGADSNPETGGAGSGYGSGGGGGKGTASGGVGKSGLAIVAY